MAVTTKQRIGWHSAHGKHGIDQWVQRKVTRVANRGRVRLAFDSAGGNLLIHKSTLALWRINDAEHCIEPVTASDELPEEYMAELNALIR